MRLFRAAVFLRNERCILFLKSDRVCYGLRLVSQYSLLQYVYIVRADKCWRAQPAGISAHRFTRRDYWHVCLKTCRVCLYIPSQTIGNRRCIELVAASRFQAHCRFLRLCKRRYEDVRWQQRTLTTTNHSYCTLDRTVACWSSVPDLSYRWCIRARSPATGDSVVDSWPRRL